VQSLAITESSEIAQARRAVSALAARMGFHDEDTGRAALVATEICSNIVKHGNGGELIAQPLEHGERRGLGLIGLDKGAGMNDVAKCLKDGFSTGGSPGTGLGAINRMSQYFDLYSQPGRGTAVLAQLWSEGRAPSGAALEMGAIVVPKSGETECGDSWCHVQRPGGALVMAVDGLGHGLGASQAAKAACAVFQNEMSGSPAAVLQQVHTALRTTRGAAIAVLQIDWEHRQLLAAGVGNIVAAIVDADAMKRIPSGNGIVGHATPTIRELSYPLAPTASVVLHSDGLTTGWQPERYPGLLRHHAAIIAGVLYRDCKRGRDDALVVVIRRATP
jgi:anti-sigma regulatory factor (Ser/Thr protein kinase)